MFGPFVANSGSEVNVSGGSVGDGVVQTGGFNGQSGSVLNLSGGNVFGPIGISGEMNMSGGTVTGDFFFANPGSMVNISGGTVSAGFFLSDASEVNISGGTVLHSLDPSSGSVLNINGGTVNGVVAREGSEVNMSGGALDGIGALSGSQVTISGGAVGGILNAFSGSDVELIGGDFELNGAAVSESTISFERDDVFTGALTDGSAFFITSSTALDVTLTLADIPPLDLTPMVVSTAEPNFPSGLRPGQTLTILSGGELGDNFDLIEATLNVEGCLLYTSPSPRDATLSRMPSSA